MDKDKTEEYTINRSDDRWKTCKLLGTVLDAETDIKRRHGLAIDALNKIKHILQSTLKTKMTAFDAYVSAIFLYNSEIWTLTKKTEERINIFHLKLIQSHILKIKWPDTINNEQLYKTTNTKPWSEKIKHRRLKWFVHLMRLPDETPAKIALKYAQQPYTKPRGRPVSTWLSVLKKQLEEEHGLSWEEACMKARDRDVWKNYV